VTRHRLQVVHSGRANHTKFVLALIAIAMAVAAAIGLAREIDKKTGHQHQFSAEDARAIQTCSRVPLDAAIQLLRDAGANINDSARTVYARMPARVVRAHIPIQSLNAQQIPKAMPQFAQIEGCGGAVVVSGSTLPVELPAATIIDSRFDRSANGNEVSTIAFVIPRARDDDEN
jgi:hypothetical protein